MKNFLNTPVGSFVKVFLSIILMQFAAHGGDLWAISWKEFVNGAFASLLPILINMLNPNDPRYGAGKDESLTDGKRPKFSGGSFLLLFIVSVSMFISGCAAPFQGGGYLIPLALFFISAYLIYANVVSTNEKNKSSWSLLLGVLLLVAASGVLIWMISAK